MSFPIWIEINEVIIDVNNVIDRLQSFEMTIMGSFEGVTSITMAMDLKALNEQLKTISQLTLLKYTTALIAAANPVFDLLMTSYDL